MLGMSEIARVWDYRRNLVTSQVHGIASVAMSVARCLHHALPGVVSLRASVRCDRGRWVFIQYMKLLNNGSFGIRQPAALGSSQVDKMGIGVARASWSIEPGRGRHI